MQFNKCKLVRDTCSWVFQRSKHVKFNPNNLEKLASKFSYTPFNEFSHHKLKEEGHERELLYLFTLDCLNFCFWPLEGFEYEHLASSVKQFIDSSSGLEELASISEKTICQQIFKGIEVPLADERARFLREMANTIKSKFGGSFVTLIEQANKSAVKLLEILTSNFPNFQDHSIYQGHQIHFYKRPQILIGDIYAKFEGKNLGEFHDISELTMFPDYRVPQILNEYGILEYSKELQDKINNKIPLLSGSDEEIEIRSASVTVVEKIKEYLESLGKNVKSIEVDWFLWEEGERNLSSILNHHRTLTVYY